MTLKCFSILISMAAAMGLLVQPAIAQNQTETNDSWTAARQPDGRPNLQGVWDFRTITPLQRPEEFSDRAVLTEEDEATLVQRALDRQIDRPPPPGGVGGYNQFWMDRGTNVVQDRRTSLIVDPSNGRLPPLMPHALIQEGSLNADLPAELPVRYRSGGMGADGPEDRGLAERCLMGFNTGPPMDPGGYNNNMQLFQTSDYVVILNEMVHDVRIVPLDGRSHLPETIRQWLGNSRGRWEGDTLIVETTNFTDKTASYELREGSMRTALGTGQTLHLTERFSRVGQDSLHYEYTVTDPVTFTQPFTVAIPMKLGNEAPIFEYACHEGNYAMLDILAGARSQEHSTTGSRGSR